MTHHRCCCGYTPTADYTLTDHLGEMLIPADDTDAAGQAHAEAARDDDAGDEGLAAVVQLRCLCGHAADSTSALDEHLLAAFTVPGTLGRDGRAHVPAGKAPGCATVRA
jgi:hypothetical protein